MPGQQSTTVPKGRPADPSPSSQPIDQRIVVVRQLLESVFTELETVLDVCLTVHNGLENQNATQDVDFAHVLQRCGSDSLCQQLLDLTTIIEQLGGTTSYSKDEQVVAGTLMSYPLLTGLSALQVLQIRDQRQAQLPANVGRSWT